MNSVQCSKVRILSIRRKGKVRLFAVFLLAVACFSLGLWRYSSHSGRTFPVAEEDVLLAKKAHGAWTGVPALITEKNTSTIFWYKNDRVSHDTGQPLVLLDVYKKQFEWPPEIYVNLNRAADVSRGHVFVTSADYKFYRPMLDLISSIQHMAPGVKIIVWDLGGYDASMIMQIKSLCDVQYRRFDFSAYPSHVRSLKNYAFKPLVIAETLKHHPHVVYMDSSLRFVSTGNFSHIKPQLLRTGGILQMLNVAHSIFVATHPQLYSFFPCDMEKIKHTDMGGGGFLVVYRTERVFKNILLFWVLCALEQNCIEPISTLACDGEKLTSGEYAGCHRFDQSAISILLGNSYNYNTKVYRDYMAKDDMGDFVRVARSSYEDEPLKTQCNT